MSATPTPETDAELNRIADIPRQTITGDFCAMRDLARKFERERDAERKERDEWRKVAEELQKGLLELNRLYRSNYDEPGPNPPFIRDPLTAFESLKGKKP